MKSLLSGSLLLLFLFACTVSRYSELKRLGEVEIEGGKLNPYLPETEKTLKFTAAFDIYGHYISGLLFIKQMDDSTSRAVLTNELGIRIFDFVQKNDAYETVFCLEPLNKSILTNALCRSIFLIGAKYNSKNICESFAGKDTTIRILSIDYFGDSKNYFFFDKVTGNLAKLENASSWLKNLVISYMGYKSGVPDSVGVDYSNLDIKIKLKLLKNNAP